MGDGQPLILSQAMSDGFARLSGDFNPIHTDPTLARRLRFGRAVLHGMHLVLATLEQRLAAGEDGHATPRPTALTGLTVRFTHPVHPGEAVTSETGPGRDAGTEKWLLKVGGQRALTLTATWADAPPSPPPPPLPPPAANGETGCRHQRLEQVAGLGETLPLTVDRTLLAARFPALAARLPLAQTALLLAATRLVGMVCPGRDSLFSGFRLQFDAAVASATALTFRVTATDPRINSVTLALEAAGCHGELEAFFRQPPVDQPTFSQVAGRIAASGCAGGRALVIGGSRGLGEVSAKIFAAAGAEVAITHRLGAADAERVAAEIRAGGGVCHTLAYDVLDPRDGLEQLPEGWFPTHLCYFATPPIVLNPWSAWRQDLFERYGRFYVGGFQEAVHRAVALQPDGEPERLAVFFPSTIFIDRPEPGTAEYAAAKAAGEALGRHLAARLPGVVCHAPRLDRLRTDQTGELPGERGGADPLRVLPPLLLPPGGDP